MVLNWLGGSGKAASVADLIARRKYDRAIELLRTQFKGGSRDPRMRLQLADVLILSGRGKEAVPILQGLADELAAEGFAAKAIALLKKIEKIEPGRTDVERKLASLIQDRPHTLSDIHLTPARARATMPELGLEEAPPEMEEADGGPVGGTPVDPVRLAEWAPPPPMPSLTSEPAQDAAPEDDVEFDVTEEPADPLAEGVFRDQLLDVIQDALHPAPEGPISEAMQALVDDGEPPLERAPSPLFGSFSEDELVAVMRGLRLLSFNPGDIIITEGEAGDSLFVLTTGAVKAFVRNQEGRSVMVREMPEGSFFGEISILTGKPRTATITAAASCELLELDRASLDDICARHPRVMDVLQEFHRQRAGSRDETQARRS